MEERSEAAYDATIAREGEQEEYEETDVIENLLEEASKGIQGVVDTIGEYGDALGYYRKSYETFTEVAKSVADRVTVLPYGNAMAAYLSRFVPNARIRQGSNALFTNLAALEGGARVLSQKYEDYKTSIDAWSKAYAENRESIHGYYDALSYYVPWLGSLRRRKQRGGGGGGGSTELIGRNDTERRHVDKSKALALAPSNRINLKTKIPSDRKVTLIASESTEEAKRDSVNPWIAVGEEENTPKRRKLAKAYRTRFCRGRYCKNVT